MKSFAALAALLPLSVHAATYTVRVGLSENTGKKGIGFDPSSVGSVQAGDTLDFVFMSGSHSVVQSTFDAPCTPKSGGGIDSGVQTVPDSASENDSNLPKLSVKANDTSSLWFFDQSGGTCNKGGVFSVNPTTQQSDANFKAAASTAQQAPTSTSAQASASAAASSAASGSGGGGKNGAVGVNFAPATLVGVLVAGLVGMVAV